MMFLLDTNICIHILNQADPEIEQAFRSRSPGELAVCSMVKAELLYGAHHGKRAEANLQRLEIFFAPFVSFAFDDSAAREYGLMRADLAARGRPIGPNDLIIAAIARANNATLVTRNAAEFERVYGLEIKVW